MNLEKLLFSIVMRLVLACILLALLTSCSPYLDLPPPTSTAKPTARPTGPADTRKYPSQIFDQGTPSPTCTVRTGIPAGRVNMRSGAGVRHAVVRVLSEGEILEVIQRAAWLKVIDAQGNRGYIYARYCTLAPARSAGE